MMNLGQCSHTMRRWSRINRGLYGQELLFQDTSSQTSPGNQGLAICRYYDFLNKGHVKELFGMIVYFQWYVESNSWRQS